MSIYFKLTLFCLILILFSSLPIFYFSEVEIEQKLKEETLSQFSQQARYSINSIERFFYQGLNDIQNIAEHSDFKFKNLSNEEIEAELKTLEQLNELYYSFSYFNIKRIRLGDSKGLDIGKKHSNSKYWRKLDIRNSRVIDISYSASIGDVVIHFAALVKDKKGNAKGVIVSRVLIEKLYNILQAQNTLKGTQIDVIDPFGFVIYSNHSPESVLKDKYGDRYGDKKILKKLSEDNTNYYETNENLYVYAKEQGYLDYKGQGLSLIISVPKDEAFKAVAEIRNKLLIVLIPVIIIAVIITLIAARVYVRPIIKLGKAADRVAEGDLNTSINVNTKDEVGSLATRVKEMVGKLKNRMTEQQSMNLELNTLNNDLEDALKKLEAQKKEIEEKTQELSENHDKLSEAYRENKFAQEQIKANMKQIKSSITYAERIQRSMLPEKELLDKFFSDNFIFFSPRDIVSGDFYWIDIIDDRYLAVAAADCTGHGVPGAIMSMLCSNLITNVITQEKCLDPAKAIDRLNKDVIKVLHQEKRAEQNMRSQDGMEIALCIVDMQERILEFAGGGRPMYFVREGELEQIKGTKMYVGGASEILSKKHENLVIEKHRIVLKRNDRFYMFSDGYQDQFGGMEDRKFMVKRFRNMIKDIHLKPMYKQEDYLNNTLLDWRGMLPQTDDVIVIGLKV